MSEAVFLTCPHAEICSVCSWIQYSDSEQRERKTTTLREALQTAEITAPSKIPFRSAGLSGFRDRVDLTYSNGQYGFFQKNSRDIFSVQECPILSKSLFDFFQDVRKIHIPIQKGSLRFRVSPSGERGLWLDFANEDIRDLLAEKKTLQSFMDLGFVEIGQRRKKLTSQFKLTDPEFHKWTRTWSQGKTLELYSLVGSFSQSGDTPNRLLVEEMQKLMSAAPSQCWVEFGAGNGNLTFPLAGLDREVKALEFEALSVESLKRTLNEHSEFSKRIQIQQGDFQRKAHYHFQSREGVLVNPPRSGLKKFLDPLFEIPKSSRPQDFLYMSCFLESFIEDGKRLKMLGYQIQDLTIVDQFPNSSHFEILSRWQLD